MNPKNPTHIGAIFALLWIILKLALFLMKLDFRWELGIILNLMMLPVVIYFGIRLFRKRQKPGQTAVFIEDLKAAMRPAALYSLIIGLFLFIYYAKIDDIFISDLRNDRIEILQDAIDDAGGWKEYKQRSEEMVSYTEEEYLDKVSENINMIISPFSAATASLIGLMLLSFLYSLLFTIFYRKVLQRYS
jgi:hypothetical protein